MKLDSAILYTNNIDKIATFYTEVIGLREDYRYPNVYVSFIFGDGSRLGINKSKFTEREIPGHQTFFISTENLKNEYERLKKLGYDFYEDYSENDWGDYFAILDIDGNKIGYVNRNNKK